MKEYLCLLLIVLPILANAQTSGGQIRRPSTPKTTFQKPSAKKTPVKKRVRQSSTPSKTEPTIETLEIIPIQDASIDGRNVSEEAKSKKLQTVIYTVDGELYMANYSEIDETQSWGPLYVLDQKEQPESKSEYASITLNCSWEFQNTFDEEVGPAPVTIQMVKKDDGVNYMITINNGHIIVYQGFVSSTTLPSSSSNSDSSDEIQPIAIDRLAKYNVVVATYSVLANAQGECQRLRNQGWGAQIYLDSKMYRVLMVGMNDEPEAVLYRDHARKTYPNAYIMSVDNGRTYKYE